MGEDDRMKRLQPMPQGAQLENDGRVRFRLWAPTARTLELELHDGPLRHLPMRPLPAGWYELVSAGAGARGRYRFRIDGGLSVPDPASRFQPDDIPGAVIDSGSYDLPDADWVGRVADAGLGGWSGQITLAAAQ